MEYILIALAAFYIGWKVNQYISTASFVKILEELNISEQQLEKVAQRLGAATLVAETPAEDTRDTVEIKVEQHQGRYYAYRCQDDEFVAHGDTPETLLSGILARLPAGSKVTVDKAQGGDIVELALARYAESQKS